MTNIEVIVVDRLHGFKLGPVTGKSGQARVAWVSLAVTRGLSCDDWQIPGDGIYFLSQRNEQKESFMAASVKHELHQLADTLPENATWDDVIEEARFRRAVEVGMHAADRDAFATDDEVRAAFACWGVQG